MCFESSAADKASLILRNLAVNNLTNKTNQTKQKQLFIQFDISGRLSLIVKEGFEDLRSAYKIGGVSVEMGTLDFGRSRNCIMVRKDKS